MPMTSEQRTPGPWRTNGLKVEAHNYGIIAVCLTPQSHGTMAAVDNARFIVRACNAHERLVAALREALHGGYLLDKRGYETPLFRAARAALAAAEKE